MKQHINKKQWNEITKEQQELLAKKGYGEWSFEHSYLQFDIGQMIKFLDNEAEINQLYYSRVQPWWHLELTNRSIGKGSCGHIDIDNDKLCNALWEAVKYKLNEI